MFFPLTDVEENGGVGGLEVSSLVMVGVVVSGFFISTENPVVESMLLSAGGETPVEAAKLFALNVARTSMSIESLS